MSTLPPWSGGHVGIVMMSALGDTVHVLPVVNALKRHAPDTHVTWVLQPGPAALIDGHPAVERIVRFDKRRGWRAYADVRRACDRPFDLLLALQVYAKAGLVAALLPAHRKLGFDRARARDLNWLVTSHRIPPHEPQHVQDQYLEFCQALAVPHAPVEWNLGPWPHERPVRDDWRAAIARPVAALVIGTSHPQKDWVPERWAELSDALSERYGLQPVLVGGTSPGERATERVIMATARHRPLSVLGAPLRALVGQLDAAALVVSLDTGPLHMAVALRRPLISLMGYNNPKRVGPWRWCHDLIVDAYGEPGEQYPVSLAHRAGRMTRITVADVLAKVDVWKARDAGT